MPLLIRMKIITDDHRLNLFLPVPFIFILFLPFYLLCTVADIIVSAAAGADSVAARYIRIALELPKLISAATGTEIFIKSADADVKILIR